MERAEMLERLIELQLGPQTRGRREEYSTILGLMERNEGLMEEIERRDRGLRDRVEWGEAELLRILDSGNETGARRGGE